MFTAPISFLLVVLGFFCGWTVASNVSTLAALPFSSLWVAFAAGLICAAAALRVSQRVAALVTDDALALAEIDWGRSLTGFRQRVVFLVPAAGMCIAAAAYFVKTQAFEPFWFACIVATASAVTIFKSPSHVETARTVASCGSHRTVLIFAILCAAVLALYFVTSMPDGDDAFYLNLPIGMKSSAGGLLVADTVLGDPDWPILGSNYRAESLPTLTAAISAVTGVPVIIVAHSILPALWCLVFACAIYVMSFALFRRYWPLCAFAYLLILTGFGASLQGYGVHGVLRLYHGKAVFIAILAPLIVFVAFAALKLRSTTTFLLLAALQICALGATANSIYLAPLCAGLVCGAWFLRTSGADRLRPLLLLCASTYNLLVGAYLVVFDAPTTFQLGSTSIASAVWSIFNSLTLMAIFVCACVFAALAPLVAERWRLAAFYFLTAFICIVNPLLWDLYADHVTGDLNFRLFWAIPFPFFVAVGVALAAVSIPRFYRWGIAAAVVFFAFGPDSLLRTSAVGFFPIKVDREAHRVASIAINVGGEGRILAAAPVSLWVPTFEQRRRVIVARYDYIEQQRARAPAGDVDVRLELQAWVDGQKFLTRERLQDLVALYCISTIVFNNHDARSATQRMLLQSTGASINGSLADIYAIAVIDRNKSGCPDAAAPR